MDELPEIIIKTLKKRGVNELRQPQNLSIKKGLLEGKNLVVSSPTSSGKTLIAEIAMVKHFENRGKTLYIVPLKSLASEKFNSFKERYGEHGLKTALSIGDFDKQDKFLDSYDLIITTSEKTDSLIRHNASFFRNVSCVVIDEVHLLNDNSRGPTLEILITILRQMLPSAQFIALSATIKNDELLSKWLSAELVKSDYRPVELREGVFFNNELFFTNNSYKIRDECNAEESIASDTMVRDKQIIFFLNSRRNAQGLSKRLEKISRKKLSSENKGLLDIIADKILYALEYPTEQCRLLSSLVRHGCAFHHAGLVEKQRNLVEEGFRNKLIKVLCATPTLAAGVNLPAFRVVVRDLTRFSPAEGCQFMPVLEVKQMFGRAGRPGFEEFGEALAIAKSEGDKDSIFEEFINAEVEEIYSKLGVEPALRTHVLSLISNRFCNTREALHNFFSKTFFAEQYNDLTALNKLINNILVSLIDSDFILQDNVYLTATPLGKRVCELYLDPFVADKIINSIKKSKGAELSVFNVMQALCYSEGIKLLRVNNKECADLMNSAGDEKLLIDAPNPFSYEYDSFLRSLKTASLFEAWMDEESYQKISEDFKIFPGDVRNYVYTMDWLLYSLAELCAFFDNKSLLGFSKRLRTRLAYGVKDELFGLVSIKGIGRVRARKLFANSIKSYQDVVKAPLEKLANLVGAGVAQKIRERVNP